jgi:hypothetical protein
VRVVVVGIIAAPDPGRLMVTSSVIRGTDAKPELVSRKPGDQCAAKHRRWRQKMNYPKENLPFHLLKFGVDHHGVIVPILRLSKGVSVPTAPVTRPPRPKWKTLFRLA